jgi:hypothetical protein
VQCKTIPTKDIRVKFAASLKVAAGEIKVFLRLTDQNDTCFFDENIKEYPLEKLEADFRQSPPLDRLKWRDIQDDSWSRILQELKKKKIKFEDLRRIFGDKSHMVGIPQEKPKGRVWQNMFDELRGLFVTCMEDIWEQNKYKLTDKFDKETYEKLKNKDEKNKVYFQMLRWIKYEAAQNALHRLLDSIKDGNVNVIISALRAMPFLNEQSCWDYLLNQLISNPALKERCLIALRTGLRIYGVDIRCDPKRIIQTVIDEVKNKNMSQEVDLLGIYVLVFRESKADFMPVGGCEAAELLKEIEYRVEKSSQARISIMWKLFVMGRATVEDEEEVSRLARVD